MHASNDVVAIVDDDAATLRSIERLLRASGYETATFESAEAFLHSSLAETALCLVLDIQLQAMSGIELFRELKSARRQVPVVFITARDHEATHQEALSLGCVDFLQKPFQLAALTRALDRCRSIRRQGSQGA